MTIRTTAWRPFQFGIGTLLLLTTLVAGHLAMFLASPMGGVLLLLVGVPGLIRAYALLRRSMLAGEPISLHAKLDAYFTSLVATLVAYCAAGCVVLVTGGLVYLAGVMLAASVAKFAPLVAFAWFLTFLGLMGSASLAAGMFFALYWETLPSTGDDDAKRTAR